MSHPLPQGLSLQLPLLLANPLLPEPALLVFALPPLPLAVQETLPAPQLGRQGDPTVLHWVTRSKLGAELLLSPMS